MFITNGKQEANASKKKELDRRCGKDFELADYIYVTTNYSIFKTMRGNRSIDRLNLRKITDSIKEVGPRLVPIQVNEDMEIVDGQHRLEVLKSLGLPVYFNFDKTATLNEVQSLNVSSRKWVLKDFIRSYAEVDINSSSYRFLSLLIDKYPTVGTNVLGAALFKQSRIHNSVIKKKALHISQEELDIADETLSWVVPLVNNFETKPNYPKSALAISLCLCYRWVREGADINLHRLHKVVQDGLVRSKGWAGDTKDCIAEIERCYNYGLNWENKRMFNRLLEDNMMENRRKSRK